MPKIDVFQLGWWRRLRVPWTARRSNQSNLKETNLEYSVEWLMLKLKLQYFGHLMWRTDSLEKTPMLGKIEGERLKAKREGADRKRESWMTSLIQWTWFWASSGSWWCTGKPGILQSIGLQRVRHDWAIELTEVRDIIWYLSFSVWLTSLNMIISRSFRTVFIVCFYLFQKEIKKDVYTHTCTHTHRISLVGYTRN